MDDIVKNLSASDAFIDELSEISCICALEEMASCMAHEFAQPLGAVATFSNAAERMLNRPEPMVARAIEVLKQINHEALSAGERLQGIRHLFAQPRPQQRRSQLTDILAEVRPVLDGVALRGNAALQVDLSAALPDVQVERLRIQHVLLALVKNAVDHSSSNSGDRVIRIDASAQRYTVETGVSNSGDGVPPAAADKIFRAFFTTKAKAAGLGLATCRAIIEAHDGKIGYQNLPAGGVRFWFRLPIAPD